MANNRMYLRCKGCGKMMVLGEMFPGMGYYFTKTEVRKGQELSDFLSEHSVKCHEYDENGVATNHAYDDHYEPFDLIYENDPNF